MARSSGSPTICPMPPPHQPRQRLWRIVAKRAVLAAGATERPIVFGGNDRPGVMLAAAVRTYVNRFAVGAGQARRGLHQQRRRLAHGRRSRAAPASRSRPSSTAGATCAGCICKPPACASSRGGEVDRDRGRAARCASITVRTAQRHRDHRGRCARRVGRLEPERRTSPAITAAGRPGTKTSRPSCPAAPPKGMTVAGAANGTMTLGRCLAEGVAGRRGARPRTLGFAPSLRTAAEGRRRDRSRVTPLWHVAGSKQRPSSICRTTSPPTTSRSPQREGFRSVEHLKRYTTLGMATDQGKTANVARRSPSWRRSPAAPSRRPAPPPSARPTRRSRSARFAGHHRGKDFRPTRLHAVARLGASSRAPCSSRPGRGCARNISRSAGETRLARDRQPRGAHRALGGRLLRRLDARQDRRAGRRTPAPSSTGSTSTPSRRCRSAARATA